jgi:serine/threonine protein kinase
MDTKRSEPAPRDDGEKQIVELKAKLEAALSSDDFKEVLRLSALCQKVQEELDSQGLVDPIVATAKYDMWCFGALLYYLCTGMQLFNVDINEEVRDDELRLLVGWSNELKSAKLAEVRTGWPKKLLEKLLEKDPNNRPANWSEIIHDLESTMEEHKGGRDTHEGRDEQFCLID